MHFIEHADHKDSVPKAKGRTPKYSAWVFSNNDWNMIVRTGGSVHAPFLSFFPFMVILTSRIATSFLVTIYVYSANATYVSPHVHTHIYTSVGSCKGWTAFTPPLII
jgi:hypothetical protein